MINAICKWGQELEDTDVLVTIDDSIVIFAEKPTTDGYKYGFVRKGTMYLTKEESEVLGMKLIQAAGKARDYEQMAIEMNM